MVVGLLGVARSEGYNSTTSATPSPSADLVGTDTTEGKNGGGDKNCPPPSPCYCEWYMDLISGYKVWWISLCSGDIH